MKKNMRFAIALMLVLVLLSTMVMAADWPQFLGNPSAQGTSDGRSATLGDDLALRWERNTGNSWDDVPGTPIVVDGFVYFYSSQYLRKVELATGKEVASAQVYGAAVNQFFINIAYGDGMIFVPCQTNNLDSENGVRGCFLRVFDAKTLTQLYITESLGSGQMQSPVMYHDGYFVTGIFGRNGIYAGFNAKDEDPSRGDEIKKIAWKVDSGTKYGFSFNGAAFVGNYCYFGCGNTLFVVDYQTGEQQTFNIGEGYAIHSTISYSAETKRLYVASTHPSDGASIFSYALQTNGLPDASSAKEWVSHTEGGATQSTPVVYRGRLYIGGGGSTMGSAEPFHVVDALTMEEIYSVPVLTKGSAAISTAYASSENGYSVYIYLVPYAPTDAGTSQLWILTDKQGQTKADYEIVDGIGHRQYSSQSVVIAEDGALLWYNDAAHLYCYENLRESAPGSFRDTRTHWAKEQIAQLAQKGILNGTGNGNFSPNHSITRAQVVQALAKLSGEDLSAYQTNSFDDVKSGVWYAPAVAWAEAKGITSGSGARTFSPNAQITRQDLAVMLQRYVSLVAGHTLPAVNAPIQFTDGDSIAAYARDAVSLMQSAGIINGFSDGSGYRFAPKQNATRAQAAAMIAQLDQAINGQD